nr:hypothetical protein [uncultured Treponema sp.]
MDAAGYIRSDVSADAETHSQNYTRMYSFDECRMFSKGEIWNDIPKPIMNIL